MNEISTSKHIGKALIVSADATATHQLAETMGELALSVEVCVRAADAVDRIRHSKIEVGVIDFSMGVQAIHLLEQVRASASNRTAVTFAITNGGAETTAALKAG